MPDTSGGPALLRLMAWLSPAFPVGGFSYSHGLEWAVEDEVVCDRAGLEGWISDLLAHGSAWNDAVLFAESWRRAGSGDDLRSVSELAEALAGSRERHMETMLQGSAFLKAAEAWTSTAAIGLPADCPYCVGVGAVAGVTRIPLQDALAAWLQAFASNLAQAAIRLGVAGQSGALETIASLEPLFLEMAARAAVSSLDDLGSATVVADMTAMRHETQYSRLFRS